MIVFSWWLIFSKYELKEHWVHLKYAPGAPGAPRAPVFSARFVFSKYDWMSLVYWEGVSFIGFKIRTVSAKHSSLFEFTVVYWVVNERIGNLQINDWFYSFFPKILSYFQMFKKRVGLQMGKYPYGAWHVVSQIFTLTRASPVNKINFCIHW